MPCIEGFNNCIRAFIKFNTNELFEIKVFFKNLYSLNCVFILISVIKIQVSQVKIPTERTTVNIIQSIR